MPRQSPNPLEVPVDSVGRNDCFAGYRDPDNDAMTGETSSVTLALALDVPDKGGLRGGDAWGTSVPGILLQCRFLHRFGPEDCPYLGACRLGFIGLLQ